MPILQLVISTFLSAPAWAYPEFIGYKYASCLTCHYNGNGNGPLNDYGRALWSAEIAGRLFSRGRSDEQLAEASGFLGKPPLPWWVRPGLKARRLFIQSSPGGANGISRDILMQADFNLALFLDRDQKYAFVGTYGYVPQPLRLQSQPGAEKLEEWISREHYFRWQASESLWLYFGKLDKPYGVRIVNHTAYSRARVGVAQNDQAHGVIAQIIKPDWEWSLNAFAGNLEQDAELRQVGGSSLLEYEFSPAKRVGFSLLSSSNKFIKNDRAAIHTRIGLGNGSALLLETGLIKDTPKSSEARLGYYLYAEAIQRVVRGYHLFVVGQSYKDRMQSGSDDNVRGSFGVLMFPLARTEFRLELQNTKRFNESPQVQREGWDFMGQLHLSL